MSLLFRQLDGVALGLEPLAPVLLGPAILRQEHGVAIGAAERAAQVRIARPVEPAALDEAGGGAEDRVCVDDLHGIGLFLAVVGAFFLGWPDDASDRVMI